MALLDVILNYDCNLACDYCTISPEMRPRALTTPQVAAALQAGIRDGFDSVSFTGGEPTIRGDLLGLLRASRQLGFRDVKVQSNGLLLASAPNLQKLRDAGMTRLHISIHTHEEAAYERLVRREGTFASMASAVELAASSSGLTFVVDVILKNDTWEKLPAALEWLHARGVREVHLWYVSLTDGNAQNFSSSMRMSEVMPTVKGALAWANSVGMTVRSLHIPRCLLGVEFASHAYDPGADRVRVVSPDSTFDLKDSRLAGRVHVAACEGCRFRDVCPGIRADYLQHYGEAEFVAVAPDGAR
ncbi:MAG: radical SAM protein [Archangium sp.]